MSKYGFLDQLDLELSKNFPYDYEINWDKKNHAVEVNFLLEVANQAGVPLTDEDGEASDQDIYFEDSVVFYNPSKSSIDASDYLAVLPYEPKKGLSSEFIAYFVDFLTQTAQAGQDDLMDFLQDPEAQEFAITWDAESFAQGRDGLVEKTFHPYPRY